MNQYIYVKFAELTLKGKNRFDFINQLVRNIQRALKEIKFQLVKQYDCLWLEIYDHKNEEQILAILRKMPGISWIHQVVSFPWEQKSEIPPFVSRVLGGVSSFRLDVRRHDKSFPQTSVEITSWLAGYALEHNPDLRVNLHEPELRIGIEVKRKEIFVYWKSWHGTGGLPVGSSGRCLVLLSGGIDSPVAASLLMRRGLNVDFLTFITPPHTKPQALEKAFSLSQIVTTQNKLASGKLFVCNFSDVQHELSHVAKESYRITLMRRAFFRIAKRFAEEHHYAAIATGESLGQVASQTVESMQTISDVLDDFLILRPLVAFDKETIINEAVKIGTYELSILPFDDSCSLFAPKHPVTKPTIQEARGLEASLELLEPIIDMAYKNIVVKEESDDHYSPNFREDSEKQTD